MGILKCQFCRAVALIALLAAPLHAAVLDVGRPQAGAQLVSDPGGQCTAIRYEEERGAVVLALPATAPGLYRLSLPVRLLDQPGVNSGPLQMTINFGCTNTTWLSYLLLPSQLDATTGAWTVITRPVTLTDAFPSNSLKVSWFLPGKKPGAKKISATETTPNTALPVAQIDYPAILIGNPIMEPVTTTLAVEKVWPEFVHVYPGGTNPVAVTVRNFTSQPADATVRLEMKTGLDESTPVGEQRLQVPALGEAVAQFPWIAGTREYGYAAVATVSAGGRPVHTGTEYFSVSTPVWKTAIQGNGFLSWYGREAQFPAHVADNRREYVNVEEAFSWQPSSWSDLNPTTEDWWTGQGNAHNTLKGLHEWIDLSHSNGIKMITYSWPTISGKAGFDWGQKFPELLCQDDAGVGGRTDVYNLHLWDVVHSRHELWQYYAGGWIYNMVNLGLLRTIDHHAQEVIRSSKTFGWDGIRFDMAPGWSAMGTNDVQWEIDRLGVRDLMNQLMPECMNTTSNVWTGEQISNRNIRYFRHVFSAERSPNFAMSYNVGSLLPIPDTSLPWFHELSKGGGQLMNEAIRTERSISNYMEVALWHTEPIRAVGGYSCLFKAEASRAPLATVYSAIFTFATGSHPYLDYGWLGALPGDYTQFMTRYGEYCWDLALAPVTPEKAGVTVESKTPLVWEKFIRQRSNDGQRQTVVHLITQPEWDLTKELTQAQVEWPRNVVVKKQCQSEPTVWLLTAEPETTAVRLTTQHSGNSYSVTVPSIHYWTMLVWSEKP
jgi:hypothetical protein